MDPFSVGRQRVDSRRPGLLIVSLAFLILSGCALRPATDDGRLEHHAAPHHPSSFPAAVDELDRRFSELSTKPPLDVAHDQSATELADIVRWLPELAADSDLKRADWEAANRLALELEKLLPAWLAAKPEQKREALTTIQATLGELRQLASRSDDWQLPPGESTTPAPATESSSSAVPVQSAEK
jgi:hypothetical protein